jgi:hypothetical protein
MPSGPPTGNHHGHITDATYDQLRTILQLTPYLKGGALDVAIQWMDGEFWFYKAGCFNGVEWFIQDIRRQYVSS